MPPLLIGVPSISARQPKELLVGKRCRVLMVHGPLRLVEGGGQGGGSGPGR